ncbi:AAA family ATPase [Planococcus shenhongbingii]|uniref:AAA family ATPase n=1 Tax=Planococcus shenhongbingii TaxID=3058398 RepID=UPI00261B8C8E|nr:AAA family ATPase [Planococcus sp. N016]WKA58294.1 AAA family ATPase [Planococcus sp. N016]
MTESYLKKPFQAWMTKQKKSNGEPYKTGTINAYTNALRNSSAKLQLKELPQTDLFHITSFEQFKKIHNMLKSAPNFEEIDIKAGNKAYSNSMVLYSKFLKELEEPAVWIFQGNPKYYDVVGAVNDLDEITWSVNQYPKQIKEGDEAYIWLSGPGGGIVASGTILCNPEMKQPAEDDFYSRSEKLNNEPYLGVDIFIQENLTERIVERTLLLSDERTKKMEILTYAGATNFKVTKEENIVIKSIIDGSYEHIPASASSDYSVKLENSFEERIGESADRVEEEPHFESYLEENFLSEVYMSEEKYHTLKNLLIRKKNLILSGAPGVGKTYAAERLAYSIMGEKDKSRVQVVQFHQSYSYEDFIMGYRPNNAGFSLANGPFYQFCKKAEPDDRPYFFIIDEINRGNLSKIFGELLMLIENDKRGKELRLLYSDEQFSVPENVYIIGMMNTADRSLAMIDYALRRRFAFYEFEPAFASEGFKKYQDSIENGRFGSLINTVAALNQVISEDASLGNGFRIGHSYFSSKNEIDDEWLSEVVEYELIPLINEYWFDEPSQVEYWNGKLRSSIRD